MRKNEFTLSEVEDIFLEQNQHQITDAAPDPVRHHGSLHHGAAYMDQANYPPHGASAGQEGGLMQPEETIEVLGDTYTSGLDVLGVGPVNAAAVAAAKARLAAAKNRLKPGKSKSATGAIASATAAASRAETTGNTTVKASKTKLRVPLLTKVKGEDIADAATEVVLGAMGDAAEIAMDHFEVLGLGPSAATNALAMKAAASRAALATALAKAQGASQKVDKANASVDRHAGKVHTFTAKANDAATRGNAALAQAKTAKSAISAQVARLRKIGVKIAGDATSDKQMYDHVPGDAILFPEGKAWDVGSRGSWLMFYGSPAAGYAWVKDRWAFSYGPGGPNAVDLAGVPDSAISRASTQGFVPTPGNLFQKAGSELAGATFGPLIGDPSKPDFAGLRYAAADNKWFWLNGEAPAYATKEMDDAIALLAQQEADANAAADAAAQAAADQAQAQADADAAALQAQYDLEDAAIARAAEVQAAKLQIEDDALQAQLAQQQAKDDAVYAVEQAKIDQEAQRQDIASAAEQAKIDQEAQRQDVASAAAQAKIDQAQQMAELEYLKSHPEEVQAARQQQQDEEAAQQEEVDPFADDSLNGDADGDFNGTGGPRGGERGADCIRARRLNRR